MKRLIVLGFVLYLAAACSAPTTVSPAAQGTVTPAAQGTGTGMGMGLGRAMGMMERHTAPIPEEYVNRTNPIPSDDASLTRGAQVYATNCATCHGDGGMGDGPAGSALNPQPAPIARTSQEMGDNYLFWRISEGGVQFKTAMPVWKSTLDEAARWDVINYVRAVGQGKAKPASAVGGAPFDPAAGEKEQAELLARAVAQGVLTQSEADLFAQVHGAIEKYLADNPAARNNTRGTDRETAILSALVQSGDITQAQADAFLAVQKKLSASGLMP